MGDGGNLSQRAYVALVAVVLLLCINSLFGWMVIRSNRASLHEIQAQRAVSIRSNCEDLNRRHRQTAAVINKRAAHNKTQATPSERRTIEAGRAYTILLINALAPTRDCEFRVYKFTSGKGSL